MKRRDRDPQSVEYLERRYQAALQEVGGQENSHIDRITAFMVGAEWEAKRDITVGDLSASMIGETIVRLEHEGGAVEGPLLDIEIDAEVNNIPRGDEQYRAKVTHLRVGLRIGSFTIDGLPPAHPVEVVR